jgi:ribosomal-protein-alanine N-acetyltransferase
MITVTVQIARPDDISSVADIADESGLSKWTEIDYEMELGRSDSIFLVASTETMHVAGFVLGRIIPGPEAGSHSAELYNIGVLPEIRRRNVGTKLLVSFQELCREAQASDVYLEVRSSNTAAIRFYEKHGFAAQFSRPSFYSNPIEDATVMRAVI